MIKILSHHLMPIRLLSNILKSWPLWFIKWAPGLFAAVTIEKESVDKRTFGEKGQCQLFVFIRKDLSSFFPFLLHFYFVLTSVHWFFYLFLFLIQRLSLSLSFSLSLSPFVANSHSIFCHISLSLLLVRSLSLSSSLPLSLSLSL